MTSCMEWRCKRQVCTTRYVSGGSGVEAHQDTRRPTPRDVEGGSTRCASDRDRTKRRTQRQELTNWLSSAARRTAMGVDRAIPCRRDDPPRGIGWEAVAPPPIGSHHERLLHGVLGERDVAHDADHRRNRSAVGLAEHALDRIGGFHSGGRGKRHALTRPVAQKGRTSIGWPIASTTLRAQLRASSRLSASTI